MCSNGGPSEAWRVEKTRSEAEVRGLGARFRVEHMPGWLTELQNT